MCGLCGALGAGPAWEREGRAGDDARWRMHREALATAAQLTSLLAPHRIRITADPRSGFVVAFPTGRTATAASLTSVWHLLDRSKVPVPDPLAVPVPDPLPG
jgi:hypothetical protein